MKNSATEILDFDTKLEQFILASQQDALQEAAETARAGRYPSALKRLEGIQFSIPHLSDDCLILKAKIAAQQGRLEEARDCFSRVLQSNPTHLDANSGLVAISKLSANSWMIYLASNFSKMVVLAFVIFILVAFANKEIKTNIQSATMSLSSELKVVREDLLKIAATTIDLEVQSTERLDLAKEHRDSLHEVVATRLESLSTVIDEVASSKEIPLSKAIPMNSFVDLRDYRSELFRSKAVRQLEEVKLSLDAWRSDQENYRPKANINELLQLLSKIDSFQGELIDLEISPPSQIEAEQSDYDSEH